MRGVHNQKRKDKHRNRHPVNRYSKNDLGHYRDERTSDKNIEDIRRKHVIAVEIEKNFEPTVVVRTPITHPQGDLQTFLAGIQVTDRTRAQYAVVYENGQPVMTFSGEFMYFVSKERAFQVQESLNKRFDIATRVIYGPVNRKAGQTVPAAKI